MDDMFFDDRKKREKSVNSNNVLPDTDNSEAEEFNLTFKRRQTSQTYEKRSSGFVVDLPEDEVGDVYSQAQSRVPQGQRVASDRTPQGQRVASDRTPQGQRVASDRTPQGQRVASDRTPQGQRVASDRTPQGQRVASDRTPQGQRVGGDRSVQGRREPSNAQRQQNAAVRRTPIYKEPPKKKKSLKKIVGLSVAAVILIFILGIFAYGYSALGGLTYTEIEDENAYIDESTLVSDSAVRNILFIGSDEREGLGGQRSDSMILFSIDTKNKQIKLTSFMRDSYVYIPSKNYSTKLNAAYNYGGAQLLIDTIEYNFHIKIDDFVMVDYNAFKQFVNLLGGITVDGVTEKEAEYMRVQVNIPEIQEGTNEMDGRAAMWYCRIRYVDDDFHRTQRQRKVLTAIISKAAKTNLFKLIDICKEILPNISTNLERNDLMSLAVGALFKYMRYDIVQQQVPAPGTWSNARISGQDVLKMDFEENRAILKEFIYNKVETEEEK